MPLNLIHYIIAGFLLLLEAFSPGLFIFICFAIAAFVTAIFIPLCHWTLVSALAADLIFSLIALFLVRPFLKTILKLSNAPLSYPQNLIGKEGMVFKTISAHEPGVVKLYDFDETWLAKSNTVIEQGTTVLITGIEANYLLVKGLDPVVS